MKIAHSVLTVACSVLVPIKKMFAISRLVKCHFYHCPSRGQSDGWLILHLRRRLSHSWCCASCLKLLKRSADLLHYYVSVIRPTLEYACPVWHSSITSEQSDTLEKMQNVHCVLFMAVDLLMLLTVRFAMSCHYRHSLIEENS